MLLNRIVYKKFQKKFHYIPYQAGDFLATLKYNPFLERSEKFGFKLKNLDAHRLMDIKSGVDFLLLFRRIGKETYRRLSFTAEVQYNVVVEESDAANLSQLPIAKLYRRTSRYHAYVARLVNFRNRLSNVFSLRVFGVGHRAFYHPYAGYHFNRFDLFRLRAKRG